MKGEVPLNEPLAPLVCPTDLYFQSARGSLKVTEASCEVLGAQTYCTCAVNIGGEGYLSVDNLAIANFGSSSPQITMNYSMGGVRLLR